MKFSKTLCFRVLVLMFAFSLNHTHAFGQDAPEQNVTQQNEQEQVKEETPARVVQQVEAPKPVVAEKPAQPVKPLVKQEIPRVTIDMQNAPMPEPVEITRSSSSSQDFQLTMPGSSDSSGSSTYSRIPTEAKFRAGGIGGMYGKASGTTQWAVALAGMHQSQDGSRYSHGYGRIEIGNGLGIAGSSHGGHTFIGMRDGEHFFPFVAIHGDISFSANTKKAPEDFIELQGMGAVGVQWAIDNCKSTIGMNVGGSLGTLGSGGVRGAAGPELLFTCPKFAFAAHGTRIYTPGRAVDKAEMNMALPLTENTGIGLRGEVIETYGGNKRVFAADFSDSAKHEIRGFVTYQGVTPF